MSTALITGASSGIGLEIARLLARDHDVVLAARSESALRELAASSAATRASSCRDLSEPAGAAKLAAEVPEVDVLVNNAGFGDFGDFATASPDRLDQMIELNVGSLTRLSRAYLPAMLERGSGRIMNVASTAAFQPGPLMAVYYATKAYVLSFSEALAEETRGYRRDGHRVVSGADRERLPGRRRDGAAASSCSGKKLPTSASVAAFGVKAMNRGDVVAVPGFQNKVLAASVRFSPRPVIRRVVHKMQEAKPA